MNVGKSMETITRRNLLPAVEWKSLRWLDRLSYHPHRHRICQSVSGNRRSRHIQWTKISNQNRNYIQVKTRVKLLPESSFNLFPSGGLGFLAWGPHWFKTAVSRRMEKWKEEIHFFWQYGTYHLLSISAKFVGGTQQGLVNPQQMCHRWKKTTRQCLRMWDASLLYQLF